MKKERGIKKKKKSKFVQSKERRASEFIYIKLSILKRKSEYKEPK